MNAAEKGLMPAPISRRNAIASMAALGATTVIATAKNNATNPHVGLLALDELGWDEDKGEYTLPPLPYSYDALDAVIDEQTMRIHHDKHHAGYVRGVNNALKKLDLVRREQGDPALIQHWQRQLSFHMGGHINHTMFWTGMKSEASGGGGQPSGILSQAITQSFGSFAHFAMQFKLASTKVEGSGWGWLVYEPISRQLLITQMQNQQDMMFTGAIPLLGVDVWEHAYYLKYQNRRAEYVEGFMRLINWDEISRRFEATQH